MNLAIWKFSLKIEDEQVLKMPYGSQILSIKMVKRSLCLYALVDTEYDIKHYDSRTIEIFGTGNTITEANRTFIGTFTDLGENFVGHVFERKSYYPST